MRSCCLAQGTISSHLWWNMMEDYVIKRKYICMCIYIYIYIYIYEWLGHFAEHIYVYICMTGSLCYMVEIDRTL